MFSSVSCKKLPLILEQWIDNYLPECGLLPAQAAQLFGEGQNRTVQNREMFGGT